MAQEKGYKTKTLIVRETDLKTPGAFGYKVRINSNGIKKQIAKQKSAVIPDGRDAARPYKDFPETKGALPVPVDAHEIGIHLGHLLGDPVSTVVAAKALDNAAVRNVGSGKVGIPCTGHGLAKGAPVVIDGTSNYDGAYILAPETTANELVVLATYAAETVSSSDTCTLASQVTLSAGNVRNVASGLVGLPALGHGLPVGAEITVAGTTNYDGTFMIEKGSSANEIIIADTYVSETLAGDETATARFYDHVFTVQDEMESFASEKAFPTLGRYARTRGIKINGLSMELGGSGELTANLDLVCCIEEYKDKSLDVDPVSLPFVRFNKLESTVREGGVTRTGRITALSLSINTNLDATQHTIDGDGINPGTGELGDLPEGDMEVTGSLTALLKDTALMDRAELDTVAPIEVFFINGGYRLFLEFEETELDVNTPDVADAKGLKETYNWRAFKDVGANQSSVKATLRNNIKTYWE